MKWISWFYLVFSVILAGFILYVLIDNMINYNIENASYYLGILLKYLKYFLLYILLNIVYLLALILNYHKKKFCNISEGKTTD